MNKLNQIYDTADVDQNRTRASQNINMHTKICFPTSDRLFRLEMDGSNMHNGCVMNFEMTINKSTYTNISSFTLRVFNHSFKAHLRLLRRFYVFSYIRFENECYNTSHILCRLYCKTNSHSNWTSTLRHTLCSEAPAWPMMTLLYWVSTQAPARWGKLLLLRSLLLCAHSLEIVNSPYSIRAHY